MKNIVYFFNGKNYTSLSGLKSAQRFYLWGTEKNPGKVIQEVKRVFHNEMQRFRFPRMDFALKTMKGICRQAWRYEMKQGRVFTSEYKETFEAEMLVYAENFAFQKAEEKRLFLEEEAKRQATIETKRKRNRGKALKAIAHFG